MPNAVVARRARSKIDKFERRRNELVTAALSILAQRGIAQTSLRDIAEGASFSHGVLHYYFEDRDELIICCVHHYKEQCIHRYLQLLEAEPQPTILDGLVLAMQTTVRNDALQQRLWYDMRFQSLFDEPLRPAVLEIESELQALVASVLRRVAEERGQPLTVDDATAYNALDGIMAAAVRGYLIGDKTVLARLAEQVRQLCSRLIPEA